jgi:hypothetical protein
MNGKLLPTHLTRGSRGLYRAYQCGLCHFIGPEYALRYRLFAGPDLVFYNLFLDVCAAETARVERRACVLAPMVTRLPSAIATERTGLAAAVGIWFGALKLQDDWNDEGRLSRWLAWKAFAPGAARAREHLVAVGFPVEEIERLLAEQSRIEASGACTLDEAAGPTVAIARLTFGFAGRERGVIDPERAGEIGAAIGGFLFHLDNLADWRDDLRRGQYNALRHAYGDESGHLPEPAREATLAGARAAIERLRALLGPLPLAPEAQYLRETLVLGFTSQLNRHARARDGHAPGSALRDRAIRVYASLWGEIASRPSTRALARPRVAWGVALMAMLFARAAWAAKWWPEGATPDALDVDSGIDTGADTGVSPDVTPPGNAPSIETNHGGPCDCTAPCDHACQGCCDEACGDCGDDIQWG